MWTDEGYSWLGRWQDRKPENHVAFEVSYDDMLDAQAWLVDHSIEKRDAQDADHNRSSGHTRGTPRCTSRTPTATARSSSRGC